MTPEELLKPRYKIMADYPYSPYMIGSLVEETLTRFLLTRTTCYDSFKMDWAEQDNYVPEETILKYSNLFKKLEWWEEREISDMPEYVKLVTNGKIKFIKNSVSWFFHNGGTFLSIKTRLVLY